MSNLFIGTISGTSMDAIDVALVDFSDQSPKLLGAISFPIPKEFKDKCFNITQTGQCLLDEYCQLDMVAGSLFSDAILSLLKAANISAKKIRAIGSHGQNIRHCPNANPPFTLQIGNPNLIAEKTGITTIADFRNRDIIGGGQGAPLAPGFHASVFRSSAENRIIVNIGGISNITNLPMDLNIPITGFDTGPGNGLMDAWIQQQRQLPFDENGQFAKSGTVNRPLLQFCLEDPYFLKYPPKSTGREYFNLDWLNQKINASQSSNFLAEDIQATLLALTTQSIANAILQYGSKNPSIFVCGGGVQNQFLMEELANRLQHPVNSTEKLGIAPDWVEAILFAWLAKQTLEGKPGNCPSVTGAKNPVILGGIFGYQP